MRRDYRSSTGHCPFGGKAGKTAPLSGVLAILALLAFAATSAQAFRSAAFSSSFATVPGGFAQPLGVAVDDTSGDVYVVDRLNNTVDKFTASGEFVLMLGSDVDQTPGAADPNVCTAASGNTCVPGGAGAEAGQFNTPFEVAVDNSPGTSKGDVYVVDAGNGRVEKFSSAGGYLSQITETPTGALNFVSPIGHGPIGGVGVDPSTGDLYAGEPGREVVDKFSSSGAYLAAFPFREALSIGVDAHEHIYVAGTGANGGLEVDRFSAAGALESTVEAGFSGSSTNPEAVAVDPSTGNVYADDVSFVSEHLPGGVSFQFGAESPGFSLGIAVNPSNGTVYTADIENSSVHIDTGVILPDVATSLPGEVQGASVTLQGTVNPLEVGITACEFEYGTSTSYGQSAPCEQAPAGEAVVPVTAAVSGLIPNTTYHYRLDVTSANSASVIAGGDQEFTTPGLAPAISEQASSGVTGFAATLTATVNPGNAHTTFHFVYGTTSAYGQTFSPDGDAGSGFVGLHVTETIAGLQPGTTYHYALIATNSAGSEQGPDETFTTLAASAPVVVTGGVSGVGFASALIAGTVDARGYATSYEFDIGTSTAYGTPVYGSAGSDVGPQAVTLALQSLQPGTTYHYRLLATNAAGTSVGADESFTTPAQLTPLLPSAAQGFPVLGGLVPVPHGKEATITPSRRLTRAQKLTKALRRCSAKHDKRKRASCQREARKRYGANAKRAAAGAAHTNRRAR
jgi:NHL repeat